MQCPLCGGKTHVTKSFYKKSKVIRYRKCNKCKKSFQTTELESSGWEYKEIVKKMKDLLREVK